MDFAEEKITVMTSLNFCTQESGVKGGEGVGGEAVDHPSLRESEGRPPPLPCKLNKGVLDVKLHS